MMSNTIVINARELVNMSEENIFAMPDVPWEIIFEDKTIHTTRQATIYSWYLWHMHRTFPELPIKSAHHVQNKTVTPTTHLAILATMRKDCIELYTDNGYGHLEEINGAVYNAVNMLYNGMTLQLESYITSISILDFVDIAFNPEIKKINDSIINSEHPTDVEINDAHAQIEKILVTDPSLGNNAVARAAKHKMVKVGQIMQCTSARGYVTDVDNYRFPHPIKTGYAAGMRTLTDFATESRTAAVSEFMTETPMQQSEYLSRLLQISTSVVKRIHPGDCGSKEWIIYLIDDANKLIDMQGIHYYGEDGVERVIDNQSTFLIGTPLKIRSVFTCKHPDRYGVCAKCFGDLSYNAVFTDNLGHNSSIALQSPASQLFLSHKHHTASASARENVMSIEAREFLTRRSSEPNVFYLKPMPNSKTKLSIMVQLDEGKNIDDLKYLDMLDSVTPERITSLSVLGIILTKGEITERSMIVVKSDSRNANFTMEMLKYIHEHGWEISERGSYVINMDKWDYKLPFLTLPEEQFSPVEYSGLVRSFIKGGGDEKLKITDPKTVIHYTDVAQALHAFHDLVAERMHVNLSHLQVILFSTMARDVKGKDYNLPSPENRSLGQFTKHDDKMKNGNISAAMSYQTQTATIFNPNSYLHTDRPTHEFDWILLGDIHGLNN